MIQIPLSPQNFAAVKQKLAQQGIDLPGNEGTISKMGVTASYAYDGAILSVKLLQKPFFLSEQACEDQLRGFLSSGKS